MRSTTQDGVIGPDIRPGWPRVARPGVGPLPPTWPGWRRRIGRTVDPCGVSPVGVASSWHCSPAAQRSRPGPPKSQSFLRERAVRCNQPEGDSFPARTRRTSENPPMPTAKISASSLIRFSIHSFRSDFPSLSKTMHHRVSMISSSRPLCVGVSSLRRGTLGSPRGTDRACFQDGICL